MSTMQPARIGAKDWAVLAALSVLWGGSFLFYKVLAGELAPVLTVFGRVALGAVAIGASLAVRGQAPLPPRRFWGKFLLLGLVACALPFLGFAWGETRISGGTAAILNAMTPTFTVLVTGLVLHTEPLTRGRMGGVLCGLLGVAVLVGPQALVGQDFWGQAACLGAAACYAVAAPYARTFALPPPQIALGQLAGATLLLLPVVAVTGLSGFAALNAAGWGALLGIALLSTGIAYLLFFWLLPRIGPTNLVLVTFLVPISALLLDAAVLGEPVTPGALAGMALIGLGLAFVDGRLPALLQARFRRAGLRAGAR